MASKFAGLKPVQVMEFSILAQTFANDTFPKKVNLVEGAYFDENGKPWVLPVVRKTERMLANDENTHHGYLPVLGSKEFITASMTLLLGKNSRALKENRVVGVQTVGGAGALEIGGKFLVRNLNAKHYYVSNPTWDGHDGCFPESGFEKGSSYRYWHSGRRGIDIDGLLEDLSKAEENSVVILHACGHNPTGCDPTREQWAQIARVMKEKRLFPFFDLAYQGISTGDLDEDAAAVRYFVDQGFELMCAQSCSKNFGLYGQRIGSLTVVANDAHLIPAIASQLSILIQRTYRHPSSQGSNIVTTILNDPALSEEWKSTLKTMHGRIKEMRIGLRQRLEKLKTPGSWEHITSQIGMFSYTGLSPAQMECLRSKHHVYAMSSGRINMGGLNKRNLDHVAHSIHDVVISVPNSRQVA